MKHDLEIEYLKKFSWKLVDADGVFKVNNQSFKLDDSILEYRVHNKYNESKNYTNESVMMYVGVAEYINGVKYFYNEHGFLIHNEYISEI